MAWAAGTFSRIYGATGWTDDKNNAVKILASRHDTHDQDLADGINSCLTRDNQAKPTSNFLPATDNTLSLGSASFRWLTLNGQSPALLAQENTFSLASAAAGTYKTIFRNQTATGYTSFRVFNDQNSATRSIEIDYAGSSYASSLVVGGPTGESGAIGTTGAFPLSLSTSNTERVRIAGDGSVINLQATAVQVNGVNVLGSNGSGTLTLNGGTTAPTVAYQYFKFGNLVVLRVAVGTFTSNSSSFSISSIPAAIQPAAQQEIPIGPITDNSANTVTGSAVLSASGTITLYKGGSATGWTSSGTKGFNAFVLSYYV